MALDSNKSQVSFRFSGSHNQKYIVSKLVSKLSGMRYSVDTIGTNVYKMYVRADDDLEIVMHVCKGIQGYAMVDTSRTIR